MKAKLPGPLASDISRVAKCIGIQVNQNICRYSYSPIVTVNFTLTKMLLIVILMMMIMMMMMMIIIIIITNTCFLAYVQ